MAVKADNDAAPLLWHLGLTAFALRAAAAVITRVHPIFPSYYFNDAAHYDAGAWQLAQNWSGPVPEGNPTYLANEYLIAAVYTVAGHHPIVAQIFNCALGAFCAVALAKIGTLLYFTPHPNLSPQVGKVFKINSEHIGLIAGALFAFWPSCIFYNSQILKDNVVLACLFGALWALCALSKRLGDNDSPSPPASPPREEGHKEKIKSHSISRPAIAAAFTLLIGSLFRWYLMLFLALSFTSAEVLFRNSPPHPFFPPRREGKNGKIPNKWRPARTFLIVSSLAVLIGLKISLHRHIFGTPIAAAYIKPSVGVAASPLDLSIRRLDPKALSDLRKNLQQNVEAFDHRPVQTFIRPDLEFKSWLDVAWFLPQGLFYAAFMPLPGLYPLGRNLGRWMAAFENLGLLGLAALGIGGAVQQRKTPAHWMTLFCLVGTAAVSGLLEPDLGAASRHKLQYFPLLFLFAAPILEKIVTPATFKSPPRKQG